jgi:hypothetical protein
MASVETTKKISKARPFLIAYMSTRPRKKPSMISKKLYLK